MARRRLLVPEAREAMNRLKQQVIEQKRQEGALVAGTTTQAWPARPDGKPIRRPTHGGVPRRAGEADPGVATARQAGRLGGEIGGTMVQRLVRIAREELTKSSHLANPQQVRTLLGQRTGPEPGR
ncbi:small, acid-soluble spore protein, alpha/beta type [Alicyclobacillus macrosporangiidus]|uniref:Small, acid-soluble spore protein, alpha/beta type n=1 Tax=Alicyclobacillus macrosporangiidus TaxID=392015 RepID=A0A1I7K912_9BACL|nr:small, acid-soluble spore protein, alpha/beta type [Alicyclobacillus macrosporangiidus]SFU93917.1 Small, acid-soluble spore protein, alpha/beta type [Alicyclobacillus macrosporangiidus]